MRDVISKRASSLPGVTAAAALWLVSAGAGAEGASDLTAQGRAALGEGQFVEAAELFDAALEAGPSAQEEQRLWFYGAVARQQMAPGMSDANRQVLLEEAARLYSVYLDSNPESAAAANNLARVYEDLGWPEQAVELYEQAIAGDKSRQGLYLQNYAQLLDRSGKWEQASTVYKKMAREQPLSAIQQESMAARYAERGLEALAGYLWTLSDAGSSWQVAELALDALERSANDNDEARIELLALVCVALSQMDNSRKSDPSLRARARLQNLRGDALIGKGVSQMIFVDRFVQRVLASGANTTGDQLERMLARFRSASFDWWSGLGDNHSAPERGVWPVEAFGALLRSFGESLRQAALATNQDDQLSRHLVQLADACFTAAAELPEGTVDPVAVQELVRLKVATDDLSSINALLDRYRIELFRGKAGAYSSNQVKKIFRFHKTLGELYTQIGRWGNSDDRQSAVFQLEYARDASREIERQMGGEAPAEYRFTPQMVNQLERAYKGAGEPESAQRLRVEEAEHYKMLGDADGARLIYAPLRDQQLANPDLDRRLRDLQSAPTPDVTPTSSPPSRVIGVRELPSASTGEIRLLPQEGVSNRLTEEQLGEIQHELTEALAQGRTGTDPARAQSMGGALRSIELKDGGRGNVAVEIDEQVLDIPFEKVAPQGPP